MTSQPTNAAMGREITKLREALLEAAERIEGDDHQIHSEWGVGPYEADPYIEELRALARGDFDMSSWGSRRVSTRQADSDRLRSKHEDAPSLTIAISALREIVQPEFESAIHFRQIARNALTRLGAKP